MEIRIVSKLAQKHIEHLRGIGFDEARIQEIDALGKRFNTSGSKAWLDGFHDMSIRDLRGRAYTQLMEAVSAIRHTGKFVFHCVPVRGEGYVCRRYRKWNAARTKR